MGRATGSLGHQVLASPCNHRNCVETGDSGYANEVSRYILHNTKLLGSLRRTVMGWALMPRISSEIGEAARTEIRRSQSPQAKPALPERNYADLAGAAPVFKNHLIAERYFDP